MALAQMEETLASVGDFISDEDSRRAVEEKVMDDEGAVSGNSRHCVLFSGCKRRRASMATIPIRSPSSPHLSACTSLDI